MKIKRMPDTTIDGVSAVQVHQTNLGTEATCGLELKCEKHD